MPARIAIDIDGTIAGRNLSLFKTACNIRFALGIDPTILNQMGYQHFIQCAEIAAYRQQVGEDQFSMLIESIEQHPDMMLSAPVLPASVQGVHELLRYAPVSYYTVRKHDDSAVTMHIQRNTKQWLIDHHFPNPECVYFCRSALKKVIRFYENECDHEDMLVLIDDSWKRIIQDFPFLYENGFAPLAEAIKQRLVLIAFGAKSSPDPAFTNGLQVVILPSWNHIADVYPRVFPRFSRRKEQPLLAVKRVN